MADANWDDLDRFEQRLLIKLFGGGSTRYDDPVVVEGLRRRGFVDDNNQLSVPGLRVFAVAVREQQAKARSHLAIRTSH
ncbi:hypothetical protein ABIB75_001532 [Bradyrhizobium sp. GM2.2]|uniref:hypothetical protein n=1 Tax=Bradyrhizobium TaxID=374 RepID=UPI001CA4BE44|nr:hypothetical protein [Bradyrhizobium canariense]MBW5438349.1 hypothetical protein [Bradyrhizobium canariense]